MTAVAPVQARTPRIPTPRIPPNTPTLALEVWRWTGAGVSADHRIHAHPASAAMLEAMLHHGTLVAPYEPGWAWAVLALLGGYAGQRVLACSASSGYAVGELVNAPEAQAAEAAA